LLLLVGIHPVSEEWTMGMLMVYLVEFLIRGTTALIFPGTPDCHLEGEAMW